MTVRTLKASDIPILEAMAKASGYPYPQFSELEAIQVVVDDDDKPLMACGAKPILELYLWSGEFERPLAKLHAIRLLHDKLAPELKRKSFSEANVFLPPALVARFGRRLERTFGWCRNWESWCKRF